MYKAPVEEIAFTLKHIAGMGEAISKGFSAISARISSTPSSPRRGVLPQRKWRRLPKSATGKVPG